MSLNLKPLNPGFGTLRSDYLEKSLAIVTKTAFNQSSIQLDLLSEHLCL